MNKIIKAIPATYNGIEYRSRTEARWAVFFDLIGVGFDYEREGYQTKRGWYVPDFWIPECKCWIEIKGTDQDHNEHIEKLREVCYETDSYGFVFVGPPKEMRGSFIGCDYTDSSGGTYGGELDTGIVSATKESCLVFVVDSGCRDREFYNAEGVEELTNVHRGDPNAEQWDEIKIAAATASRHRFW